MTDLLLIDNDRARNNELTALLSTQGISVQAAKAIDNLALGQFDCLLIDHNEIPTDFDLQTYVPTLRKIFAFLVNIISKIG